MKLIFIALLVAICIAAVYSDQVSFQSCMDPSEQPLFDLSSIDVTPISPSPGQNVTVTMTGFSHGEQPVTAGKIDSTISLKNVPMFQFHYDICEISKGGCPITQGPWQGTLIQPVPKFAFAGNYTTKSVGTVNGKMIVCVLFSVIVQRG